jgi:hypothetical protein
MDSKLMEDLLTQIKELPEKEEPPRRCQCDITTMPGLIGSHVAHGCKALAEIRIEREGKVLHVCADCKLSTDKEG